MATIRSLGDDSPNKSCTFQVIQFDCVPLLILSQLLKIKAGSQALSWLFLHTQLGLKLQKVQLNVPQIHQIFLQALFQFMVKYFRIILAKLISHLAYQLSIHFMEVQYLKIECFRHFYKRAILLSHYSVIQDFMKFYETPLCFLQVREAI